MRRREQTREPERARLSARTARRDRHDQRTHRRLDENRPERQPPTNTAHDATLGRTHAPTTSGTTGVLQSCEHPAPDMFCLCGRIYKDIFLDSDCKDTKNRDNAIQKGFELQPTLYSGINLAVLLIVAGQQFESSIELRKIGVRLNSLLGRKGSLEKMNNYWDVGQFFTVSMLANDIPKATQAAEKLFKLKPPLWYLRSVVQNLQLIQRFKKPTVEHSPQRERLNFWMDIIVEATRGTTNGLRFPKGIHEWNFTATSIKGISISKFDERCCFLYVHDNSDDFQIYFSTEDQCARFCSMVKEMISDGSGNAVELEGEGDGDTLEVSVGRAYSQPLHEEIALHKYLKHRNIVQYLGSVSEDSYIKIFMEQVPGGSLSALLRSNVPDEGLASEDRSAPPSPEDRDGGLFLLKKDSERRAILYKVLNEDQDKVISNLLQNHIQLDLDFDSTSINQIQLVLFGFQDSAAVTILIPELQTHFGPASESEGAEKEDEVDVEEAEFGQVLATPTDDPGTTPDPTASGASTLSSSHSHEPQRPNNPLGAQLGRLKQETN
ncbi:hypothetical protein CRUP_023180, partial [Coryphaenoides rupestris]